MKSRTLFILFSKILRVENVIVTKEKIQSSLPHIIGLLCIIILPMFVFDQSDARIRFWQYRYYYQLSFMIIAFYVNYLFIVPRFFFSGKKIRFFMVLIVFTFFLLACSQILYDSFDFHNPRPQNTRGNATAERIKKPARPFGLHPRLYDDALAIILVLGFSTGMGVIQRLRQEENEQKELEKAHVDTELAFLKNQINPHFFFNSLNNIYALININGAEAQKAIEKLSGLMRYLIYESDVKTVKLQKECDFIRNYIDLMKQRLTSKVKLTVDIQKDVPDIEVPPLIFMPFIENAFKHGVSYREKSFIDIMLKVSDEKITFICKNSIPETNNSSINDKGGVGIANIIKRLELLYGQDAQLHQDTQKNTFVIDLQIPTS